MKQANQIKNSYNGYLLLLMLFSPIMGVVQLLRNRDEKTLLLFGILFFGLAGSLTVYREGSDGHTHLMNAIYYYSDMSLTKFLKTSFDIITFNSTEGSQDLYLHIISFVSASVFQIPSLIHVFSGFVLGYFFTKSVLLVLHNKLNTKKRFVLIGFIFLFILIRSIGALNSIRMWTGMWIFFYGVFSYSKTKNKKYFLVIIFSIIVHFSYIIILIPTILSYFLRKNKSIFIFLYIISFFTSLGFSSLESFIPKTSLIETKQKTYAITSEDDVERFEENKMIYENKRANFNFYKAYGQDYYLNYSIVFLTFILFYFYRKKETDNNLITLISIGVGLYTFSNLVEFSPSLQGRTKVISSTFILAAAIYLQLNLNKYSLCRKKIKYLNYCLYIFLISTTPMVMFQISDFFQNFSFFIVIFPQISWILGDNDYSIRNVFGLLID